MPELNFDTLNCVYFGLFFVGVGYALFIVVTGGLSSIDLPDVDIDIPHIDLPGDVDIPGADIHIGDAGGAAGGIDSPDVSVSPLSPITISTFITTFGGVGVLALQVFNIDPRLSLLWAVGSGLATGGLMYLFASQFLVRSQASSELRQGELIWHASRSNRAYRREFAGSGELCHQVGANEFNGALCGRKGDCTRAVCYDCAHDRAAGAGQAGVVGRDAGIKVNTKEYLCRKESE